MRRFNLFFIGLIGVFVVSLIDPAGAAIDVTFPFTDSVEVDSLSKGYWNFKGSHDTTKVKIRVTTAHSGSQAWEITPTSTSAYNYLSLADTINLSSSTNPYFAFWWKNDPLYTSDPRGYWRVEVSGNAGTNWTDLTGEVYFQGASNWTRVQVYLGNYRQPNVLVRLGVRLWTTSGYTPLFLVDDLQIDNAPTPQPIFLSDPTNNGMKINWVQSTALDFKRYRIVLSTLSSGTYSVDDFGTGSFVGTSSNRRFERRAFDVTTKAKTDTTLTNLTFVNTTYYARIYEEDTQGFVNQGSDRTSLATTFTTTPEVGPFAQNFEGTFQWAADVPWAVTTPDSEAGHSLTHVWDDSPGANYAPNSDRWLVAQMNLLAVPRPLLRFKHRYTFEGADAGTVSYSSDGNNYADIISFGGVQGLWRGEEFDIGGLSQQRQAFLRFRITSDAQNERDGWYIDDVEVVNNTRTVPFPFSDDVETDSLTQQNWIQGFWRTTTTSIPPSAPPSGGRVWNIYPGIAWRYLTLEGTINLSAATNPYLAFWYRHAWENVGAYYRVEVSADGGISWGTLINDTFRSNQTSWERVQVSLGGYLQPNVLIRIGVYGNVTQYVDDIRIENAPTPQPISLSTPTNNGMRVTWKPSTAPDFKRYRVVLSTLSSGTNSPDDFGSGSVVTGRTERRVIDVTDKADTTRTLTDLVFAGTTYYARIYEEDTQGFINQGSARTDLATTFNLTTEVGPFIQNFEGTFQLAADLPWAVTTPDSEAGHSLTHVLEDSPGALYPPNADRRVVMGMNLSSVVRPLLRFVHRYGLGSGDVVYVSYSSDGSNWTDVGGRGGNAGVWTGEEFDLGPLSRMRQAFLRFRLASDGLNQGDGWYIDDVQVVNNTRAISFPFSDDVEVDSLTQKNWIKGNWWIEVPGGDRVWAKYPGNVWDYLTLEGTINLLGVTNAPLTFWYRHAWGGVGAYYRVEVSVDGGISWGTLIGDTYRSNATGWEQVTTSLNSYLQPNVLIRIGVYGNVTQYIDDILIGGAPPVPTLASPANGAQNQPKTLTLSWNPSPGATMYRLHVATDSTFTTGSIVVHDSTLTTTSRKVGPLADSTTYFWRVNAKNLAGTSSFSSVRRFRTTSRSLILGDPSANDSVTAFDASLVLRHTVGLIKLEGIDAVAADVSGNGSISPFDASLILQFDAGLITCFPASDTCKTAKEIVATGRIAWSDVRGTDTPERVLLPIVLIGEAGNVTSAQLAIQIDPKSVRVEGVTSTLPDDWQMTYHVEGSELRVGMAGVTPLPSGELAMVTLKVLDPGGRVTLRGTGLLNEQTPQELTELTIGRAPMTYGLAQNYPNPFNPMTQIRYQLPKASKVQLTIYDAFGQKIRTLVNDHQHAGFYTILWDGRNDAGLQVASGIYVYRVQAEGFTETKKMVLIK